MAAGPAICFQPTFPLPLPWLWNTSHLHPNLPFQCLVLAHNSGQCSSVLCPALAQHWVVLSHHQCQPSNKCCRHGLWHICNTAHQHWVNIGWLGGSSPKPLIAIASTQDTIQKTLTFCWLKQSTKCCLYLFLSFPSFSFLFCLVLFSFQISPLSGRKRKKGGKAVQCHFSLFLLQDINRRRAAPRTNPQFALWSSQLQPAIHKSATLWLLDVYYQSFFI